MSSPGYNTWMDTSSPGTIPSYLALPSRRLASNVLLRHRAEGVSYGIRKTGGASLNVDITFETDILLAQLTEEFLDKPLTVTHALVLHAFKPWTYNGNHASLLSTHEQSCCPDNL